MAKSMDSIRSKAVALHGCFGLEWMVAEIMEEIGTDEDEEEGREEELEGKNKKKKKTRGHRNLSVPAPFLMIRR